MAYKPNPALRAQLTKNVSAHLDVAAETAGEVLKYNVSGHDRTGVHWPDLPYPSSKAYSEEFPAEQTSSLKNSAGWQRTNDPLTKEAGFIGEDLQKLKDLEFGSEDGTVAPRAPVTRTMESPETHEIMNVVVRGKARG